ncbi:MAG: LysM peptidoglycan-binding domain-containing protein, partial [Opitutales bacterium]|nr:LysM peptidoglycan-binding domain-containing protein [Opitutales bacterium]
AAPSKPNLPAANRSVVAANTTAERPEAPAYRESIFNEDISGSGFAPVSLDPSFELDVMASSGDYVVQKGDSLWAIAKRHNVSMRKLMEANGLQENSKLHPEQVLIIPAVDSSIPQNSGMVADANGAEKPAAVAKNANPKSEKVAKSEPAAKPVLVNGDSYEVKKGDSLYLIASRFNTTVAALKDKNGLKKDMIRDGQVLKIPGKGEAVSSSTVVASAPVEPVMKADAEVSRVENGMLVHKVEAGEFPGSIARKYGMTVADLLKLNNISNPKALQVGTELKVKTPDAIVPESGNTLIAKTEEPKVSEQAVAVRVSEPEVKEVPVAAPAPVEEKTAEFADFPIIRVGS